MDLTKGHLTTYISNLILVIITISATGKISEDMIMTISAGLASLIVAYFDIKHPRKQEEELEY